MGEEHKSMSKCAAWSRLNESEEREEGLSQIINCKLPNVNFF